MIYLGFIVLLAFFLGGFFLLTYKVVEPNEAHVITVMGAGRKVYSPNSKIEGTKGKTSYFYIPFLMKRIVLPLQNVKVGINNIKLNDMEVAPFICDVISWVTVLDPVKAAEKLDSSRGDIFDSLKEDLNEIVRAVSRTTSMKQEILEIMRDRKTFGSSVSSEVEVELKKFGVKLVNLEINDIRDDSDKDSQIISDYESIRKVKINSLARIELAEKNRQAIEAEQSNRQKSEVATAVAEENLVKRQIEKDEAVGIAQQTQVQNVAQAEGVANTEKVSAFRILEVGKASVEREAVVQTATGEAEAIRIAGEKEADVIALKGKAEGDAVQAMGTAEANAKDRMAEAMKKFNDSALNVEKIRAYIEIEKARWTAYGSVAENAEIKIVNSGKGADLFGIPMNAETGANLGQFIESMGGLDSVTEKIKNGGLADIIKKASPAVKEKIDKFAQSMAGSQVG